MTLGIISGFAVLALASGFFLLKDKGVSGSSSSSSTGGDVITSDKMEDYIINAANGSYYVPVGQLTNSSITSPPFSLNNPDYTGAKYIGDDWFLMANGQYFNRKSKLWSELPPEIEPENDKGSSAAGIVAGGVAGGAGSVVSEVISDATGVVADTVKTKNKLAIIVAGAVASIAIWFFNRKK